MAEQQSEQFSKRMGMVIYIREEKREEYERLHNQAWPEVKDRLTKSNMRNFTIYHCKELGVLFAHLEYIGNDLDEDMKKIGEDPVTREWWKKCEPCQKPFSWTGPPPSEGGQGDWWTPLREVWHDGHSATSFK